MSELFDWEPPWRSVVESVVLPTLDIFDGDAVATGAVGIWLHGLLYRRPTFDGLRITTRTEQTVSDVAAELARAAAAAGGLLVVGPARTKARTGVLTMPGLTLPATVTYDPLPEEAFDPLFGRWRRTTAGWVLAVEALARAAMAPIGAASDAAATDLMVLLSVVEPYEASWADALTLAGPEALRPYVDRGGPYASPEIRQLADIVAEH